MILRLEKIDYVYIYIYIYTDNHGLSGALPRQDSICSLYVLTGT